MNARTWDMGSTSEAAKGQTTGGVGLDTPPPGLHGPARIRVSHAASHRVKVTISMGGASERHPFPSELTRGEHSREPRTPRPGVLTPDTSPDFLLDGSA